MPLKDLIQSKFIDADFVAIESALNSIETKIVGKTINLTPKERISYGSINEKNKLVVEKVNDYRVSNPQYNSPQVDWVEFLNDHTVRKRLELILNRMQTVSEQLDDTKILHDNDNYKDSLAQYDYVTYLSNQGVGGTTAIKEDIGQFFLKGGNAGGSIG